MEMESVACNLCGVQEPAWTRTIPDPADRDMAYRLVKCKRCGLVYFNPRPGETEILARSPGYQAMIRHMTDDLLASRVGRLGLRMMRQARTLPGVAPGRVLDIGCSSGDYLARMRDLGWQAQGIELDAEAARHARETHSLEVVAGRAEERLRDYADASFDLVTMWHVLEHLTDPSRVLAEVSRVLRPGGLLLLEVPNFASAWERLLGRYWYTLEPPFHLYHFSPATLRRLLRQAGLHVTRVSGEPEPAQTLWSLHLLWLRLRGRRWDGRLLWSPTGAVLLYPLELLLARFGRSNHMRALATKGGPSWRACSRR